MPEECNAALGGSQPTGSKPKVPFISAVLLPGQSVYSLERNVGEQLSGSPTFDQGLLNHAGRDFEVHQEVGMGAAQTVVGLFRGQRQCLFHQRNVQVQQEGPMEKQEVLFAPLSVPGEFAAANGQVRM